ncbi:TetR/AcrR family transcriptional regulator [Agromyces laixinhei]|uniref:TetR/AcrR family transcriptional regulator n=1 Tax=Agromyces laixinhei TaxID=2585717 RepID=UPI0018DE8720|nr:TetR/AcrR family transcriptional regulator [Agromyces laixinhei]
MRAERAAETRRSIAEAAGQLFAQEGFTGTTVAAIAKRAGVAPQTVYAVFGSKGAIVGALLAGFEENADAAEWRTRITAEPPHRRLDAFAQWSRALFSSSKAVIAATQGAASDPAMIELRVRGDRHRRVALRSLVSGLADAGALAPGLTEDQAVDRAWVLTGIELYLATTDGCAWSDDEYADWLSALLRSQLLREELADLTTTEHPRAPRT